MRFAVLALLASVVYAKHHQTSQEERDIDVNPDDDQPVMKFGDF